MFRSIYYLKKARKIDNEPFAKKKKYIYLTFLTCLSLSINFFGTPFISRASEFRETGLESLLTTSTNWLNGWVIAYELIGCGFEFYFSYFNGKQILVKTLWHRGVVVYYNRVVLSGYAQIQILLTACCRFVMMKLVLADNKV